MPYGRPRTKGETFFFTVATRDRVPVLCSQSSILSMREALRNVGRNHPFALNAFVLLPDHLHCIWTLPPGDPDFAVRWAEIKNHVRMACSRASGTAPGLPEQEGINELWNPGLGEHRIIEDSDFISHVEYIHYDPVKHGLVSRPLSWPHSTFLRYVQRGLYQPDWGSRGDVWFDPAVVSE